VTRPLEQIVLEQQIAHIERQLRQLTHEPAHTPNELMESEYLDHKPVNNGSDFLAVENRIWTKPHVSVDGQELSNIDDARVIAKERGLKGISVKCVG
jgi:hypothetical protein